ncbi:MAG: HAD hydrolase family protein [Kiritimatiellia bacterium]|jgi:hypothetical protein
MKTDGRCRVRLFVFDLDGTALGGFVPYARFPDAFSSFLDELSACGAVWCTNTTWHPEAQAQMIAESAVKSRPAVLFGRTGLLRALPTADGGFALDASWTARLAGIEALYGESLARIEAAVGDLGAWAEVPGEPLMTLFKPRRASCDEDKAQFRKAVAAEAPVVQAVARADGSFRVQPRQMDKGAALAAMQELLGVGADATLVAGDASNDLPMFNPSLARYAVCPSNASPAVKDAVLAMGGAVGTVPYAAGVVAAIHSIFGPCAPSTKGDPAT